MKGRVKNEEYKKGLWTEEEDRILMAYINLHGKGKWNRVANMTGLRRCGKSCRLRWMNYLSPNIKRGDFSEEEDDLIIRLHNLLGNRWSLIAGRVPGRTDNQVKNHWNTHLSKKLGLKKETCRRVHNNLSRLVSKTTKETISSPTLASSPQQSTQNECPIALVGETTQKQCEQVLNSKTDSHELTTLNDNSTRADQDWFIDSNDLNSYIDQVWMNDVNGHHLDFAWDE